MNIDTLIQQAKAEERENEIKVPISLGDYVFYEELKREFQKLLDLIDRYKQLTYSKDRLDINGMDFFRDFRVLFPETYEDMFRELLDKEIEDGTV